MSWSLMNKTLPSAKTYRKYTTSTTQHENLTKTFPFYKVYQLVRCSNDTNSELKTGHVRYINILTWLRRFQDKLLKFLIFGAEQTS